MTAKRRGLVALMCGLATVGVAACGSSSSSDSSSGSSSGSSSSSASTTASAGSGKSFNFGYSIATAQNPWQVAIERSALGVTGPAGGKADVQDAQLDPGRAVPQIQRFISDGDNSISVAPPIARNAMQGLLVRAQGQGIHTFALEWDFSHSTTPPPAPVDGQVLLDRGTIARQIDAAIDRDQPSGARVIYIGLPFPVVGVDYFESVFRANLGNARLIANLDNPRDNAQGALGPLQGAVAANPGVTTIVTYNGPSALAAVQVVRQAGLQGRVKIYDMQLDTASAAAIRAGTVAAAWDLDPVAAGTALGQLITAAGQGRPKSDWARTVLIRCPEYTRANIASWHDWAH